MSEHDRNQPPGEYGNPPEGYGYGPPPGGYGYEPPAGYGSGYGSGYGYGYGGPTGDDYGPRGTDPSAGWALGLAIASYFILPVILAIVALFLAGRARHNIAASGGRLGGLGLATAARVLAWINIVVIILVFIFVAIVAGAFVGFNG